MYLACRVWDIRFGSAAQDVLQDLFEVEAVEGYSDLYCAPILCLYNSGTS